jgi:hypothetical protein
MLSDMNRILLLIALLLPACLLAETVYRIVHPDGTVEFTDEPHRGGEAIGVEPVPAVPAFVAPPSSRAATPAPGREVSGSYQSLRISSPQQDEVIWFDGSGVSVTVVIQPALQSGHRIRLEMNGETVGESTSSSFQIPTVYRGTHSLRASILDAQGQVLKQSDTISFHFRQHRIRP